MVYSLAMRGTARFPIPSPAFWQNMAGKHPEDSPLVLIMDAVGQDKWILSRIEHALIIGYHPLASACLSGVSDDRFCRKRAFAECPRVCYPKRKRFHEILLGKIGFAESTEASSAAEGIAIRQDFLITLRYFRRLAHFALRTQRALKLTT